MASDYSDSIASVRALVGDGSAQWFTDDEIITYLTVYTGNVLRASGLALQNLAVSFAAKGRSVKTDDLSIDTRTRSDSFLALSKQYFTQADAQDAQAAADIFSIGHTGRPDHRSSLPAEYFSPWPLAPNPL